MLSKLLITVFALAALMMVYLSAPFVFFPLIFSVDLPSDSLCRAVWHRAYEPLLVRLSDDNLYKLQVAQMAAELCDKDANRCGAFE
ncbi:hypothetical protein L9G74_00705 [Shewanella sp. C32]|uniref:Saposin B-type domain-containing protein n=1 Tax=Shewanella electrica TaxID=515560 RepID=A0ABT2FFA1_9GAMM|nr:hypothetical protein [Shewanella electrica]MCH1925130.1 hypothetical protein [Shewanella electrica]MCS4554954.1 hypothetical protein [Shewanella electrica]